MRAERVSFLIRAFVRKPVFFAFTCGLLSAISGFAGPTFTASDCANYAPLNDPYGVCVSGNATDGTSYFKVADFANMAFANESGSATNSNASSSLPTLTQTAGVVPAPAGGAFFASAAAKYWDTLTFSGELPSDMATLTLTTSFSKTFGGSGSVQFFVEDNGTTYTTGWTDPFPGFANPVALTIPIGAGVPIKFTVAISVQASPTGSAGITDPLMINVPSNVTFDSSSGFLGFTPSGGPGGGPGGGGSSAPEPRTSLAVTVCAAIGCLASPRSRKQRTNR
jgi:hypothetical protein